jgi:cytochrome c oxidase assembly protein subunit 15
VLSGALLTYTMGDADVYVFTSLLHTIIISAYFSLLCLMAVRAWRLSRR